MTPARFGPVELGKLTRSPMVEIYHALDGARKFLRSKGVAVTSAIAMIAKLRDGGRPERLERPRVVVEDPETPELGVVYGPMLGNPGRPLKTAPTAAFDTRRTIGAVSPSR